MDNEQIVKLVKWSGLGLFIITLLFTTLGTVGAGERGVKLRFNAVTGDALNEGLYVKLPFVEKVKKIDVKVQKEEVNASAASKDLQTVNATVALNWHVQPERVTDIYQEYRDEYQARIISPVIQEAVKAATAQFTAEELVTRRSDVREAIKINLKDKLENRGFIVDEFNIVNFGFSKSFDNAIEAKVTAEQDALAAKNKLEQAKFEAQQAIETAKGRAEALRIEGDALRQNSQLIELRAIEKWNGTLPQITGGAVPFVNVPQN